MRNANPFLNAALRRIRFADGTRADLASLRRHHYRPTLPATFCRVRVASVWQPVTRRLRPIAVGVLSWPVPMLPARNRHFCVTGYGNALRFANANVRTLSRVVVHPQYRAAGLAQQIVTQLVARCPTRYVECSTTMGRYAGFLARCGFQQMPTEPGEPAYFLFDRHARRRKRRGVRPHRSQPSFQRRSS